ncbi:SCO1664 family protein [Sediminivirga luteola]|uniref:SCO1664 family protein n=1 Tax=Sediminivirga luteola TaxID=1774748 RepID=UPI001F5A2F94|nr:SCO1664 family protein [Sediminivirga luteola]MCI2263917.1 SCO1664 family protein [Sediminivirga luteola]
MSGKSPAETTIERLQRAPVQVLGRIMESSNAALLCTVEDADGAVGQAVFKPLASERRLHDFPPATLALREVAAWRLSRLAGFDVVPPTVLRELPGHGLGSLQAWVENAPGEGAGIGVLPAREFGPGASPAAGARSGTGIGTAGWIPVVAAQDEDGEDVVIAHRDTPGLRRIALFDLLANNADRKGSHLVYGHWDPVSGAQPGLYGIDQGLCFHPEEKLRTVLWGFSGRMFSAGERELLGNAGSERMRQALTPLLRAEETEALTERAGRLLEAGAFPAPPADRVALPWPPL